MASGKQDDELIIESSESVGEGGFLVVHRYQLRNRRPDGSVSEPFPVDFIDRPRGLDAVAVALYRRSEEGDIEVLLRTALRPPMVLGRGGWLPVREERRSPRVLEVVAGLIERGDDGLEGIRRRAAAEVLEEAGYSVDGEVMEPLGAPTLPAPGTMPERIYLFAAEIAPDTPQRPPEGDGSPMEEGAELSWWRLASALDACIVGEIEDAKTELCLRRLAALLEG